MLPGRKEASSIDYQAGTPYPLRRGFPNDMTQVYWRRALGECLSAVLLLLRHVEFSWCRRLSPKRRIRVV